ncbi:hypothetical protein POSPLADRAFT_1050809 [Postia placenta MAD-698-R-SB12]|uniref:Uncharacterized protein n=1 Tax=Postia placenta MAD-698-R-SB12 TaxID=670580 RepID=A0A1X6MIR0_9APHY|nr:hypothetical protein POSPLADRAFT_1050809 [Postia placenta MAD-698-R-SB12]OSX56294.1 hypothetical protein POSPLADRAFT_1050809 [Postia placenta MAD-698-R-SB12]
MIIEHQAAMTDVQVREQDAQLVAEDWIVLQIHGHVRGNDGEIKDPQVGEVSSEGNKSIDGENIGHLDVQFITQAQRSDGEVDDAVKTEKKRNEVDKRDDLGSLNLAGVSETTRLRQIFQVFETGKSPQNRTIQTSASSNQVHTPQRMPVFERCLKTKQRDVLHNPCLPHVQNQRCPERIKCRVLQDLADTGCTTQCALIYLEKFSGCLLVRDQLLENEMEVVDDLQSLMHWRSVVGCLSSYRPRADPRRRVCTGSELWGEFSGSERLLGTWSRLSNRCVAYLLHGLEAGNASVNHHQDHDEESSSEDIKGFKAADLERHEDLWYRIHHQEMSFPFIVSLLRIAFKYDLADLYKDTSVRLKAYYPTTLPAWRDVCATKLTKPSADYAILVVNIARSTNTMSILPAALLHCTRVAYAKFVNGVRQPDGTLESLSAEDKVRVLQGHDRLLAAVQDRATWLFDLACSSGCSGKDKCKTALSELPSQAIREGFFHVMWNFSAPFNLSGLCPACLSMVQTASDEMMHSIWQDLPTFMDVTVDHWGKLSMQELEQT